MRSLLKATILVLPLLLLMGLTLFWAWPSPPLSNSARADKIVVSKTERTLSLLNKGRILKSYSISLGGNPKGPKTQQGDERTPEGIYRIDYRNGASSFHRALHISYPNQQDRLLAKKSGALPGGAIMIHGLPNGWGFIGRLHLLHNWTNGCIAVRDDEIHEIWRAVPNGTEIEIRP